ncbi:hypothetical protein PCANC_14503 [Puccinia coronata f. sp. avenae]|uniref:Rad21/Rec8-like protein N-terminal domain-containing protein n=1 Tax=Puccinia coronata f. sp. avenae TaxID=200324 RepID=A0A2N5SLW9_9BASI|nr:hypothetical protein PCANC_14503 [Puccinia coronata f. sp. avenae]PLW46020.1 hypothetical protein PCASD_03492 [Puccinia coronata f. sp. avenae]
MFFSNDLLAKRQRYGWSLYWLAAVSSNLKSAATRISKKELLSANLLEACSTLTQPPEPLALRLSSALLLGIVRVYGHKCTTLHLQVQHVAQSMKRISFLTDDKNVMTHLQDSHSRSARVAGFGERSTNANIRDGNVIPDYRRDQENIREIFQFEEPDPFLFDPKFQRGDSDDLYHGYGAIMIGDKSSTRNSLSTAGSHSTLRHGDPFVSKPSEISLSDSSLALRPISRLPDEPNISHDLFEPFDNLGGEGGDIDLGIIPEDEQVPDGGRIRQPSSRFGIESEIGRGYVRDRQRHTSVIGFQMSPVGIQRNQDNLRESGPHDGPEGSFEFEPTSQFINPQFSLDEEAEQLDTLDPESLATVMSLKRKEESAAHHDRRKFIKVLVDPVTSLSAADVMRMREQYRQDRLMRASKYQDRRLYRLIQSRAKELVYGIPPYFQASSLRELWNGCVKVPNADAAVKRLERPVQEFQGVDGNDGGLEPDSSHSGQIVNNAAIGSDEREPSQGPQGAHHDLSSRPLNNLPWLEFENNGNQPEPFSGEDQERIEEIEEDVMGRQRAPSYESSTHRLSTSQMLPWNRQSLLAGGNTEGYETDVGMEPGEASIRRRSHIRRETPVNIRRRSSLLSFSREPTRISSTPQQTRSSLLPKNIEQVQQLEIDPDTLNFLAWSQSQIDDPNDFLFSDLAPVASTSGPIAAQAFIKILSLASCDLIQVIEQDEAYGEIRLKILNTGP